ncbi:MAG: aromatic ring-hydroxylating dioxygenase subunit alpha [Sphingobium sp.]|nr:aromatic ring-hydroxylating dioxygenase subunit alpha [Sphingobium sp.]
MNMVLKQPLARCPGDSYQTIIGRDGGHVHDVLALQSNPPQSDADIPFARYTSQAFFDREMESMWAKVWQYACREEHVAEIGDYYVYDIGHHSILVVRTANDEIKAYHNSCLHRGTKLKPSCSEGSSQNIQCPYHGWTWNLDGTVKDIPQRWDFSHLADENFKLPEVRVGRWNGFVFINMDAEAPELQEYLGVLPDHFRSWDMSRWYIHLHIQKELPANWKLAQEAFMEAYHTPVAHPQMTHVVGDVNMQHDIFDDHISRDLCPMASPSPTSTLNLSEQELLDRMLVSDRSVVADRRIVPEGETARRVMANQICETVMEQAGLDISSLSVSETIDSIKYNVFPNLFVFPSPGMPLIYQFRPHGADKDRCLFDQMVLRPVPANGVRPAPAEMVRIGEDDSYASVEGMDDFLGLVLDQDTNIMRWQREGMYASKKGAETLSQYQESRIRHLHDTLDKYLSK